MPLVRNTGSLAIRCFKTVETCADRLTGAAGPVFVTICWFLITSGGFAFLDVILYHKPWTIPRILFLPLAVLIMTNLYAQYFYATTTPPGNPHSVLEEIKSESSWMLETARQRIDPSSRGQGNRLDPGRVGLDGTWAGGRLRKCGRCLGPKPIRTHHCKVCRSCVMMMDHHCPWINQCVGINNQRYFVLFMGWLSISCWTNAILGWSDFWLSMSYRPNWTSWTPPILFTLIWVLSVALGVAVPMLLFWHLHLIMRSETSIEGHDNDYFSKKAKERGVIYINPYDLGSRRRNMEWYFNVGEGRLPYHTLIMPYRYPPPSTGWRFPLHPVALSRKRQAEDDDMPEQQDRSVVIGDEDEGELTDDEGGGGGFWQDQAVHEDDRW